MNISPWMVWTILGLILIVVEIFTTSFFIIFFGVGCLVAALASLLGIHSTALQVVMASGVGILGLFVFRDKIRAGFSKDVSPALRQYVTLNVTVPAGQSVPIEYQGTTWTAVNETNQDFQAGERVFVKKYDGIKIILGRDF